MGGDGRHGLEGIALLCSQAGPQGTVELDRGERAVKGICLLLELLHPGREISQGFSGSAFDLKRAPCTAKRWSVGEQTQIILRRSSPPRVPSRAFSRSVALSSMKWLQDLTNSLGKVCWSA